MPRPTPARAELSSWFWLGREAGAAAASSASDGSRRYFIFTGGKSGGLGPSRGFDLLSLVLAVGRLRASWAGMAAGGGKSRLHRGQPLRRHLPPRSGRGFAEVACDF